MHHCEDLSVLGDAIANSDCGVGAIAGRYLW